MPSFTDMESEKKIRQTINGLKKYQEVISDIIKILEPKAKKNPIGGIVSNSELQWFPTTPNEFIKGLEEITEEGLIKLGFHRLGFPELHYVLNEETSLVMVYAECKWYGAIKQFQGLIPPMERVYIPKDVKTIQDVKLLIQALSEN